LATSLCTSGHLSQNTCRGDSGSPLVATHKNRVIQVGIVSFGVKNGCTQRLPSVFTRLTSYLSWIETNSDVKLTWEFKI
jgi:elastase-2/chymotrypsin-like protease